MFDFNKSSGQNEKVKPEKVGRKQEYMPLVALAMQKDLVASYLKLLGLKTNSFSFIACWVSYSWQFPNLKQENKNGKLFIFLRGDTQCSLSRTYITQAFGEKNRKAGQNCTLFHFKYSCLLNVNGSDLFVEKEFIWINAENKPR